jgi:hypothetical protein
VEAEIGLWRGRGISAVLAAVFAEALRRIAVE